MSIGSEKRKANAIARIMEDRQVTLDEAIEVYRNSFRLIGKIGGQNSKGKTGFALLGKKKHKEISAKGGRKK